MLPKVCGVPGGTTGSLYGHINGLHGIAGKINAWSMAPNMLPTQGFATGTVDSNGNYRINGLQSGQNYGLIASAGGYSAKAQDWTIASSTLTTVPSACAQKRFDFSAGQYN